MKTLSRPFKRASAFLWNRYKQRKELERRLAAQKAAVESGQADDEQVREYYLLHLRRWIVVSLEELESIDQEMKILREKDLSKEVSLVLRRLAGSAGESWSSGRCQASGRPPFPWRPARQAAGTPG